MAVNKVIYAGETLVDLTGDSVTPETLAEGTTAHDASGKQISGTLSVAPLAYEIREKTGLDDSNTLEQLAIDAASLPGRLFNVPVYVRTEAHRVAGLVKDLQNENTISFIAMSDIHVGSDSQSRASALHAAQGAKIISKLVPIDFTAVLGDVVTGTASDSLTVHLDNLMYALRTTAIADPDLRLVGNHDANSYNAASYLSAEDTDKYIGRHSRGVTKPATEPERGYFYVDIEDKKTRVICLNTADLKGIVQANAADGHNISAEQLSWLATTLDMTGKGDWHVIVLSHHPIHWYAKMGFVLNLLDAYVGGTSGSADFGNTLVSYNFSGKNAAKLVAAIHGHTHNLIHGKAGASGIIRIGTPNGCFGRNNEYGSASYGEDFRNKYGETTTYSKTANSAKDTAFCVYTVDFDKAVVHSTCYGAGYDRVMSYADTVYRTITNVLTNINSDNVTGVVEDGTAYSATLTAASGYTLGTVTVTMGGVDITAAAYKDGVITIDAVTGDVAITAAGVKELVNYAYKGIGTDGNIYNGGKGYKENTRISTSSGNESSATGMTVTGYIWVPSGATIRVKNIDLTNGNSTYGIYNSSFAKAGTGYCNDLFGAADANGVRSRANTAGDAYYRIAGAWGSDPIITVDQEIT